MPRWRWGVWRWAGMLATLIVAGLVWTHRQRLGPVYGLGIVLVLVGASDRMGGIPFSNAYVWMSLDLLVAVAWDRIRETARPLQSSFVELRR